MQCLQPKKDTVWWIATIEGQCLWMAAIEEQCLWVAAIAGQCLWVRWVPLCDPPAGLCRHIVQVKHISICIWNNQYLGMGLLCSAPLNLGLHSKGIDKACISISSLQMDCSVICYRICLKLSWVYVILQNRLTVTQTALCCPSYIHKCDSLGRVKHAQDTKHLQP